MSHSQSKTYLFRSLLVLVRPYKIQVFFVFVLSIFIAVLEGVGMGLLLPILQGMGASEGSTGNPLLDFISRPFLSFPENQRLPILLSILLVLTIIKCGIFYVHGILRSWVSLKAMQDVRCNMFGRFLTVGFQFLVKQRTGDLWHNICLETNRTSKALTFLIDQVAISCIIVVSAALLLIISWPMTILVVVMLGTLSFMLRFVVKKSHQAGVAMGQAHANNTAFGLEALAGMRVIRLFSQERVEQNRFENTVQDVMKADLRSIMIGNTTAPISEIFAMVVFMLILLSSQWFMADSEALLPLLLTFLFVLYRLMPQLTKFNNNRALIANNMPGVAAVAQMMETDDKPFLRNGSQPFTRLEKGIRFEDVYFEYEASEGPVLEGISLEIPVGKTTAVVGASGSGKSTLADLIPRFYDPIKGRILADDTDLRDLDLTSWRSTIGVVSQDNFVFNTTIRKNIAYGYPEATDEEIWAAIHQAHAQAFVSNMDQGLDTVIGDRGVRLSGGERQRIAIARVMLRNPKILILDEATSALDSATERYIQDALEVLSVGRTVLAIAHRLSTIVNADHIVVLEQGRVVEQGTHAELLAKRGAYWEYHTLQFEESIKSTAS